jgi:hypothetical protein
MISTRLVALLPCAGSFVASGEKLPGARARLNFRALIYVMLLVNLLVMACMTGAQRTASSADPSTKIDSPQASRANAVHSLKSPEGSSP